jgi:Mannosyltransferase (PIG-V)
VSSPVPATAGPSFGRVQPVLAPPGASPAPPPGGRLGPRATAWWREVRLPLLLWIGSRALLMGLVTVVGFARGLPPATMVHEPGGRWLQLFTWYDSEHYLSIARGGYSRACCEQAFLPGYPLLIRAAAPLTGGRPALAGLLVSVIASCLAAVLLYRLATEWTGGGRRAGILAVVLLAAHPEGGFLTSVYGESAFLACCLAAWLAGRHGRWWLAGGLAAAACALRVNGAFLVCGLVVMYAVQLRRDRRRLPRPDVLALGAGGLVLGAFLVHLHAVTGSWNSWSQAQVQGWNRHLDWPWTTVYDTLWMLRHSAGVSPGWIALSVAELGAVAAGTGFCAWLLYRRHWPEAVYLALNLASLLFSNQLTSSVRYSLAWFPVLLVLADGGRRPGGRRLCLALVVLGSLGSVFTAIAFSMHHFVG